MLKVLNLKDAYEYAEKVTGGKVLDAEFEGNKLSMRMSGEVRSIEIKVVFVSNGSSEGK